MKQTHDLRTKSSNALKELAPAVTSQDRKDAAAILQVHPNTVNNYLTGKVGDIELGLQMLEFFKGKIAERMTRVKRILAA